VGDNVGDVAGMADVYVSYIATVTAAIFLAAILGLPAQYIDNDYTLRNSSPGGYLCWSEFAKDV